jgi:hypothetical protein
VAESSGQINLALSQEHGYKVQLLFGKNDVVNTPPTIIPYLPSSLGPGL